MARTERHVRAHGFPNRVLGGDMWHAMSHDCKGPEQHVSWRHMLLKFGLCGPEKCLTMTDVKRSLSARDVLNSIAEAESFLLQVQKLGQGRDSDTIEASLGSLEVQLASIVLQQKKISQYDTLQDAAQSCLEKIGVPSPWAVAASTSTVTRATREPSTSHGGFVTCCVYIDSVECLECMGACMPAWHVSFRNIYTGWVHACMRFRFSGILLSAWVHSPAIEGSVFRLSVPVSVYSIQYML